ncbi:MAG: methyltransferase domain-containing protein [Gemmataceae bacterium]|nr:methyltransferase domain-containing protein [Gemmataceae bacterium]
MKLFEPLEHSIFQPLETEMAPVLQFLTGRVLNAGCGNRDISDFLLRHQAEAVDNCDIRSSIPGAVICDLAKIPLPDRTYDSIFCNAVLEHVQFSDRVMSEFFRLLKPAGHLVLCIPFLQPFHPCPTNFRRFTHDGMIELGRMHGFETVQVLPVHSLAQTITWILWSSLAEKQMRRTQRLLKLPLLLWCQWSNKTDFSLRLNANSYQIVLSRSETPPRIGSENPPG